jgi:hypothetical protein
MSGTFFEHSSGDLGYQWTPFVDRMKGKCEHCGGLDRKNRFDEKRGE